MRPGAAARAQRLAAPAAPAAPARRGRGPRPARAAPGPARPAGRGGGSGGSSEHPFITDMGRPVLNGPRLLLSEEERTVLDARPAAEFFAAPRVGVHHADEAFRARVTELYADVLRDLARRSSGGGGGGIDGSGGEGQAQGGTGAGGRPLRVLDLCSGWESHLPPPSALGGAALSVVGHGASAAELAANPRLESWFVRDLDLEPWLDDLADGSFDAVLCCCGVYYLRRLEEVVAEVSRILVPGAGALVLTFGEDCYRSRALAGMLARPLDARVLLANGFESARPVAACDAGFRALVATAAPRRRARPAPPPPPEPLAAPAISSPLPRGGAAAGGEAALLVLEWRAAYAALCDEALELGIPRSALPRLPESDDDLTLEVVRARQRHLQGMVASFLSSGL
ncbi:hypothetical protein Rsub_04044 [Raphidocelis subcapitata]|uniref:Methyltransferase type 11 domain-containing protein n=1 Tax=Raphidocelis subcapitata TaxID=307507 RepID=A0A2V0P1M8_9CHLO|nr:hypothetical protein Rsub_04044 [Raphidocelis subcapitata]|eukprot:GBF91740.1 hypothetical protein Rsub_04044 [Raphidocelis subcapitata]